MIKRFYLRYKIPLWSILLSGIFIEQASDRFSLLEFFGVWLIWFLFFYLIIYHYISSEHRKVLTSIAIFPVSFIAPYIGLTIISDGASIGNFSFSVAFCLLFTGASVYETWKSINCS